MTVYPHTYSSHPFQKLSKPCTSVHSLLKRMAFCADPYKSNPFRKLSKPHTSVHSLLTRMTFYPHPYKKYPFQKLSKRSTSVHSLLKTMSCCTHPYNNHSFQKPSKPYTNVHSLWKKHTLLSSAIHKSCVPKAQQTLYQRSLTFETDNFWPSSIQQIILSRGSANPYTSVQSLLKIMTFYADP